MGFSALMQIDKSTVFFTACSCMCVVILVICLNVFESFVSTNLLSYHFVCSSVFV